MKTIHVFDFDDTLVISDAMIRVVDADGRLLRAITTQTYNGEPDKASFLSEGERFDFSDFSSDDELMTGVPTVYLGNLRELSRYGKPAAVVTSRDDRRPVENWLRKQGVDTDRIEIFCTFAPDSTFHGTDGERKLQALRHLRRTGGYDDFIIYDDSAAMRDDMTRITKEPGVTATAVPVVPEFRNDARPKTEFRRHWNTVIATRMAQFGKVERKRPGTKRFILDKTNMHPDLRFGQIICNDICPDYRDEKPSEMTRFIMDTLFSGCECDPFYEESNTTWWRLMDEHLK